jgi:hypothetical protein
LFLKEDRERRERERERERERDERERERERERRESTVFRNLLCRRLEGEGIRCIQGKHI